MNLTSIEARILSLLIKSGEIKRFKLHRKISNKPGEIPAAILTLKEAGYIAFAKISKPGNGRDTELLQITDLGVQASLRNDEEVKKIKWETIQS